jgi:hypothetical protein
MPGNLALASNARLEASRFGRERQPIVTIDDALADPDAVVAIAARHSFRPIGPFYPGVRAAVSEAIAMELIEQHLDDLTTHFGLTRSPLFHECYLSIVTTRPADLAPIQRLPHFDGTERERIAVLLYLDRAERGGTAFYRQRSTGFESVDADRFERYRRDLEAGIARAGMPDAAYISGDTPLFEQVHRVAGRFNRMIAYRGNTLHCADLHDAFEPVADAATGRLTLNLFLN